MPLLGIVQGKFQAWWRVCNEYGFDLWGDDGSSMQISICSKMRFVFRDVSLIGAVVAYIAFQMRGVNDESMSPHAGR